MSSSNEEAHSALALAKCVAERTAWLDHEWSDDAALRARPEKLFATHEQPETLLTMQAEVTRPPARRRQRCRHSQGRRRSPTS